MANDIVSWIHSQLADINEETAIKDLKELKDKYTPSIMPPIMSLCLD